MKKLIPFICILLITACGSIIEVDDLGENWNKGVIDPAFLGKWLDETGKSPEIDSITNEGGMYRVVSLNKKKNEPDLGKTLQVGKYHFYMTGPRSAYVLFGPVKGDLLRYAIRNDRFYVYVLNPKSMRDLLNQKYPQRNIVVQHTCPDKTDKNSCYDYIEIAKLDDAALKILSEIPNTDTYWGEEPMFTKIHD